MKKIIFALFAVFVGAPIFAQSTDQSIGRVLENVERNNAALKARRHLTDAQSLEARVGNSLENPEVEFIHKWGDPASLGKGGELNVVQSFDFPTSYVYRNRLARSLTEQYGHEYAAYRQQLLLEAQSLCIEIIALRQRQDLLGRAMKNAANVDEILSRRLAAGDANILEADKAAYELIGARNDYKINEIELVSALNRLANLNGGELPEFLTAEFPQWPVLSSQHEIIATYERMSPELLALVSEKNAAAHDVKLSRSMGLPRLSAGYKHEFIAGEKFNGLVVGMSIPMFGNRNNVKRAVALSQFADSQHKSALVDMRTELAKLYAQAELLAETLNGYRDIMGHARSIELLNKAIDAGHISIAEYFDELQPIYAASLMLIDVERDYHLVCARINMIGL